MKASLACILCLAAAVAVTDDAGRRRLGSALDNDSIRTAVDAWLADAAAAEATYGHISTWETSEVTSMRDLFCADPAYPTACDPARASFNDDISAWDTSGVTDMHGMFRYCSSFNQAIGGWAVFGGWAVDKVTTMDSMFRSAVAFDQDLSGWAVDSLTSLRHTFNGASSFNQDLGWCVDDDSDLTDAFKNTQCESTSCGVKKAESGCASWFGNFGSDAAPKTQFTSFGALLGAAALLML